MLESKAEGTPCSLLPERREHTRLSLWPGKTVHTQKQQLFRNNLVVKWNIDNPTFPAAIRNAYALGHAAGFDSHQQWCPPGPCPSCECRRMSRWRQQGTSVSIPHPASRQFVPLHLKAALLQLDFEFLWPKLSASSHSEQEKSLCLEVPKLPSVKLLS